MYEARQNKEKVSRRIDTGGLRQRVKFCANKKNSVRTNPTPWKYDRSKYPVQRMLYGNPLTAKDLIEKQIELQDGTKNEPAKISKKLETEQQSHQDPNFFTTVGYEFEFIQLKDEGNGSILQNVIHVELGKSNERFAYTDLPFSLETDAKGTIELVTPPFIIDTLPKTSIPEPDDVQKVSDLMEAQLKNIAQKVIKLDEMRIELGNFGINFPPLSATISSENMLGAMSSELSRKPKTKHNNGVDRIVLKELDDIEVMESTKVSSYRPDSSIATQVNIAMTTEDYLKVKDLYSLNSEIGKCITGFRKEIVAILKESLLGSRVDCSEMNIKALIEEIAMYLINTLSLQYMKDYRDKGEEFFKCISESNQNNYHLESSVKDFRGVWFKDSIRSLTTDLLQNNEKTKFVEGLKNCLPIIDNYKNAITQSDNFLYNIIATAIKKAPFKNALMELIKFIELENPKQEQICTRVERLCAEGVNMGKYDARPDTYLPNIQAAPGLARKKLHVVESRYLSTKPLVTWLNILKYEHNLFA